MTDSMDDDEAEERVSLEMVIFIMARIAADIRAAHELDADTEPEPVLQ